VKTILRVRALIQNNRSMLVYHREDGSHSLFGDVVRKHETSREAIRRALRVDLGVEAEVEGLAFFTEATGKEKKRRVRIVDLVYRVSISDQNAQPAKGRAPCWVVIPDEYPVQKPLAN
jgi:ADP-ribose pyrophosphatase YjhB (NUDIX family)